MRHANANTDGDANDRTRSTSVAFGRGTSTPRRSTPKASGVRASSSTKKRAAQRALFTVEATEDANGITKKTSPVSEAIRAARATLQTASYSTFASRGLTETTRTPPAASPMDWDRTATGRTPIGDSGEECCTPSSVYKPPCSTPKGGARLGLEPKTPLSVKVSTLVKDAMTALKEGRSRMESLVKSHRGKGLKFSDEDDEERIVGDVEIVVASDGRDAVVPSAAQPTASHTESQDDRQAQKEATEMLLRSAKKTSVTTPKAALVSPLRSPKPLTMTRVEPGVPMAVLADSKTTDAPTTGEETTTDCVDEEVTSQVSLPPGFDPSDFLECGGNENEKASDARQSAAEADEPSGIDVFVRMMGKVIADTFQELQDVAQNAITEPTSAKTLAVEEKVDDAEETPPTPKSSVQSPEKPTPRRSARRKSIAKDAPSTPSRRSARSNDPVTPTRRSRRLASQNKTKK